jgi:hypothetical protein
MDRHRQLGAAPARTRSQQDHRRIFFHNIIVDRPHHILCSPFVVPCPCRCRTCSSNRTLRCRFCSKSNYLMLTRPCERAHSQVGTAAAVAMATSYGEFELPQVQALEASRT